METTPLITVEDLKVHFPIYSKGLFRKVAGHVKAVDGVSFSLGRGETLGLVGESGSGKTTIGRAILRALDVTAGSITFQANGEPVDLLALRGSDLKRFRRNMQLIFQDPYASLNPRMTVRDIIAEPLECLNTGSRQEIDEQIRAVAATCKLNVEHLRRFPMPFPAASGNASASPGHFPPTPNSLSAMNRYRPWTCPSRPRSSICSWICNRNWV
jgi:peptide/nickel transport system ATP-binding protein